MTPGARIQAAIDLLALIDGETGAADNLVGQFFRTRRYAGGGDRRAIRERVYGVLRRRGVLFWRLGEGADARTQVLADLVVHDRLSLPDMQQLFTGEGYAPGPLSEAELNHVQRLQHDDDDMPVWAGGNYPEWLQGQLVARFGPEMGREMQALNERAPIDLRVNRIQLTRDEAQKALAAEGIASKPGQWSPYCLRLEGRPDVAKSELYRRGAIELQDEASQVAALVVEAQPGEQVADYCAGAGGKALALAAEMNNSGQIYALDRSAQRLARMPSRLKRSKVRNVQSRVVNKKAEGWLSALRGEVDRVLVDAPCSGSGAWRRNPEARWRLTSDGLERLHETQRQVLEEGSRLLRPGGRLVYAVCSILPSEGEGIVSRFLESHPPFRKFPAEEICERVFDSGSRPVSRNAPDLLMTPATHGTDGFYVSVMTRQ